MLESSNSLKPAGTTKTVTHQVRTVTRCWYISRMCGCLNFLPFINVKPQTLNCKSYISASHVNIDLPACSWHPRLRTSAIYNLLAAMFLGCQWQSVWVPRYSVLLQHVKVTTEKCSKVCSRSGRQFNIVAQIKCRRPSEFFDVLKFACFRKLFNASAHSFWSMNENRILYFVGSYKCDAFVEICQKFSLHLKNETY